MVGMGNEPANIEIPDKLYYPIREVAEITGVEPYVLRFWEKEFPMIRPPKGSTGHRRYRRQDIEIILDIKRLLYDQGFTISGARSQLQKGANRSGAEVPKGKGGQPGLPFTDPSGPILGRIRRELNEILTILEKT